jgi:hypothetical protein
MLLYGLPGEHHRASNSSRFSCSDLSSSDWVDTHLKSTVRDNWVTFFIHLLPAEPVLIVAALRLAARHERTEGQLEKRMEGDPAGVDGRHSGRGGDDHPFVGTLFQVVQKGVLAGVPVGVLYKIIGRLKLRVGRDVHESPSRELFEP